MISEKEKIKRHLSQSKEQKLVYDKGRDPMNIFYGNIDDLDPKKYNYRQLMHVSCGRGDDKVNDFGNIDDLDPSRYDDMQMYWISIGRGDDGHWENIDDLDPEKYNAYEMKNIATNRALNKL